MRSSNKAQFRNLVGISILSVILLVSCAQPIPRLEPDDLYWPSPPETPRIKYERSIYSEDDLGRRYSFTEKIFGKPYFDTMVRPYGVHAGHGKLLVTDIVLRRVQVYSVAEKRLLNVMDDRERRFRMPAAAVNDAAGRVYIADSGGTGVVVYANTGAYETTWNINGGKPVGLSLNEAAGRIYVADRKGHRIVVFDLRGKRLFDFGTRGAGDGMFNIPLDIAIDAGGRVYVLDSGNFRVQIFSADGAFISKFGEVGDQPGMFANPKGIAVDSDGHIYVTDAAFSNIQIFNAGGELLLFLGMMGPNPGYFHLPGGISIDEGDRIYVADQLNSRIQAFQYLKEKSRHAEP